MPFDASGGFGATPATQFICTSAQLPEVLHVGVAQWRAAQKIGNFGLDLGDPEFAQGRGQLFSRFCVFAQIASGTHDLGD